MLSNVPPVHEKGEREHARWFPCGAGSRQEASPGYKQAPPMEATAWEVGGERSENRAGLLLGTGRTTPYPLAVAPPQPEMRAVPCTAETPRGLPIDLGLISCYRRPAGHRFSGGAVGTAGRTGEGNLHRRSPACPTFPRLSHSSSP
ncbi:hypothetical protein NDU88_004257 [Pleurodeles waltl]|uniref:Uncharacterized protein n=1 Tax=Pleurodeles waltl TaxID=8319 RepID=A0AAV7MB71_PLEWA|nr:hypothetical protein NDU88_004257 [Pleurodeles waltl]